MDRHFELRKTFLKQTWSEVSLNNSQLFTERFWVIPSSACGNMKVYFHKLSEKKLALGFLWLEFMFKEKILERNLNLLRLFFSV